MTTAAEIPIGYPDGAPLPSRDGADAYVMAWPVYRANGSYYVMHPSYSVRTRWHKRLAAAQALADRLNKLKHAGWAAKLTGKWHRTLQPTPSVIGPNGHRVLTACGLNLRPEVTRPSASPPNTGDQFVCQRCARIVREAWPV
jgi:hypothetical protein